MQCDVYTIHLYTVSGTKQNSDLTFLHLSPSSIVREEKRAPVKSLFVEERDLSREEMMQSSSTKVFSLVGGWYGVFNVNSVWL